RDTSDRRGLSEGGNLTGTRTPSDPLQGCSQQSVVVSALASPRARRASAAGVEVAVTQIAAEMCIRVKGDAKVERGGALRDGLLGPVAQHPAVVTLDLSELRCISTLAIGVLVAFRRGVVRRGGRVRLAKALHPAVRESLARAEAFGLFDIAAEIGPTPGQ